MTVDVQPLAMIVEDEPDIASVLVAYFERDGFRTISARDGETALTHLDMLKPDIIILDVKLPKKDGIETLREINQRGDTPVIMATAMGEDLDKLLALKMGADDYVVKPFNPLEIVARARAILRRGLKSARHIAKAGAVEIDLESHSAFVTDGTRRQALDLTLTEFRLLNHMVRSPRRVFSRSELLDACLGESDAVERTVDSHISHLRKKLSALGIDGYFAGVRGVGYRLLSE
ncbi:response regulator [Yoonia sp. GPGPB17]|uniref:response regulator n=1 Tax=Yoonia sp. GPGPB17 TaxID=3026147 RepID=UPI0030BFC553